MKTDSLKISNVFSSGGDIHYILPFFQREYTWGKQEWETLLKDALEIYEEYQPENEPEHFLGSLVVISDGTKNGVIPAFKLVDGQQRLTSISLLFCALGSIIQETHPVLYRRIQRLLFNLEESESIRFKILPTAKYGDREAYITILNGGVSLSTTSKIPQAFNYFFRELQNRIVTGSIEAERFFFVLSNCFQVVFINLSQDESPYKIFESLNAKGKHLSQADLVRNYIAMRLPASKQEEIYINYWSKIEEMLQESLTVGRSRIGQLTAFLRHYLAMSTGVLCNIEHIYARFRDRMEQQEFKSSDKFIEELTRLRRFAEYYSKLLNPIEGEPHFEVLKHLNTLEVSTAYSFLLAAYDGHYTKEITTEEFNGLFTVLENYIVRRYICGEQTNYLNKMFPTLWREIDKERFSESLSEKLATKNYPSDRMVVQSVKQKKLYQTNTQERTSLILEAVNRHLSKGSGGFTSLDDKPTVEHIMPQSTERNEAWKTELGEKWQQTYEEFLHTLGNLTLVTKSWNSKLSDRPFLAKKQELAGHGLRLNNEYFSRDINKWDEKAIMDRAEFLAEKIMEIWPAFGKSPEQNLQPSVPQSVTISGNTFQVNSWRDVTHKTVEYLVQNSKFEILKAIKPTSFRQDDANQKWGYDWRLLPNNWRIYVNLSTNDAISFCRRLVVASGLLESAWSYNLKNGESTQLDFKQVLSL